MTSAYQLPLFEWYPIRVEFDRRREYIRTGLRHRWDDIYRRLSDDEVVERLGATAELCPIELHSAELEFDESPHSTTCFAYTASIPYAGDDELWRLYPHALDQHPDGEVFRGHLILGFFAADRHAAERIIADRLALIEGILAAQKLLILAFDQSLPNFIRVEVHRLRRRWTAQGPSAIA